MANARRLDVGGAKLEDAFLNGWLSDAPGWLPWGIRSQLLAGGAVSDSYWCLSESSESSIQGRLPKKAPVEDDCVHERKVLNLLNWIAIQNHDIRELARLDGP